MENIMNILTSIGNISALIFGAMVITAMALAGWSSYQRHHRNHHA